MTSFDAPLTAAENANGDAETFALFDRKYSAEWIDCPDCGLLQAIPPRRGRFDRVCVRCGSSFGAGSVRLSILLALSIANLMILAAANLAPILGIFIEGQYNDITIFSASEGLYRNNMPLLGTFVLFLSMLMPITHQSLQFAVLYNLWQRKSPSWLARAWLWSERARPWAMLDVFLLGVFITVSKLRSMAQVEMLPGLWALGILVSLFVVFGAVMDRQGIWDMIMPPAHPGPGARSRRWIGCLSCDRLHEVKGGVLARGLCCERCGTRLHFRKPTSIQRTWALVLGAYVLYIPANLYPVMTVIALGNEEPTTIMGGVRHLWNHNDWPYAILVFAASIIIPLFKLLGLTFFLFTYHLGRRDRLRTNTRLYRLFDIIGRWSALDIYVAAALGALVDFDNLATITPGPGMMPFALVVVLTMRAVASFDPRLMWDAAGEQHD
jgi:paraquat-inducible protein A